MDKKESIKNIEDIFQNQRIKLPDKAGVYAFWWTGNRQELLESNRNIVLKGPGGNPVNVDFEDWWPENIPYPCLYVGKSTSIKKRFPKHMNRGSEKRLYTIPETNEKQKPITSSGQLRYGIEHIFKNENNPLEIIYQKVGFSYNTNLTVVDRFYKENYLIGKWRPWFNIDSER